MNIYKILLLGCSIMVATSLCAQNVIDKKKTTEEKTVDIYKEFDDNSFADAAAVKIKDSTVLSQHLIGFKVGYAMSNVNFSQDINHKNFKTPVNFGIYYTYYHSLWRSMPYFGIHTGLEYSEIGYTKITETEQNDISEKQIYKAVQLPLLSQFRIDFWKMRLLFNLGPYGYYITSTDLEGGIPSTTNRAGIGIMGGGGLAFVIKPVEFHVECNYRYAMSHFCDPEIYSTEYWLYTHANQLTLSFGVFFRLGGGKVRK